ncbi:hypothetical protein MPTK1_6g16260 [Marchantia polymorpha subsp. ruderalis]|uniref:Uncharacterized protein n=2 Tax=Marchantia polymorpha TaxID=3197 RepID=A0AAF6BSM6_MARPO|nr:hypothetical protein MARPO_0056s0136 [Marchantia polymorpha]BBN15010.1 hypothetical protein Mp_6g16260 [Marchantia polymorpha subsp. ruderalis]|eukprot:PTQ37694.1 hypothetical protein MARPO_0056s0136 [Marchantia polymorpha]
MNPPAGRPELCQPHRALPPVPESASTTAGGTRRGRGTPSDLPSCGEKAPTPRCRNTLRDAPPPDAACSVGRCSTARLVRRRAGSRRPRAGADKVASRRFRVADPTSARPEIGACSCRCQEMWVRFRSSDPHLRDGRTRSPSCGWIEVSPCTREFCPFRSVLSLASCAPQRTTADHGSKTCSVGRVTTGLLFGIDDHAQESSADLDDLSLRTNFQLEASLDSPC